MKPLLVRVLTCIALILALVMIFSIVRASLTGLINRKNQPIDTLSDAVIKMENFTSISGSLDSSEHILFLRLDSLGYFQDFSRYTDRIKLEWAKETFEFNGKLLKEIPIRNSYVKTDGVVIYDNIHFYPDYLISFETESGLNLRICISRD